MGIYNKTYKIMKQKLKTLLLIIIQNWHGGLC